jgi:hypothetical protein
VLIRKHRKTESRKRAKEKNDEKLEPNKKTESEKFCQLFKNFPVIKTQNIGNFSKQNNKILFLSQKKRRKLKHIERKIKDFLFKRNY